MRNKTYKLQKLEKNRYSILTDDLEHCFFCKNEYVDIHEIYGGCNRKMSMRSGFCVPLCRQHHRYVTYNVSAGLYLKTLCQKTFEETHSRADFMRIIGKNYLE